MVKICIARLRSNVRYREPLHHILDSFFHLLQQYMKNHPEHQYSFYNITFDGTKPIRNLTAVENSDIVIIPSEAEFRYHVPGGMHPKDLVKSNEHLSAFAPLLKGKKLILLRSDRADNETLYRSMFGDDFEYDEIDEIDFRNNVHGMKYHFIRDYNSRRIITADVKPYLYDFIYWGWDKRKGPDGKDSGDERHKVLKGIKKNLGDRALMVGYFSNFKRDMKGMEMYDLIPYLERARTTICFNWKSNTATTSRYIEALATGVFPFVWKDYDINNTLVASDDQRVSSVEEYLDAVRNRSIPPAFQFVRHLFEKNLPTMEEYYIDFESMLKGKL